MHSRTRMHTYRADNIVIWLYSPVSEAWQSPSSSSCFGWAMNAKRLDSFGWVGKRSGWGRYFGRIYVCLHVCGIYCANVSGCDVFSNPISRQNLSIGHFCKTSYYVQFQPFLKYQFLQHPCIFPTIWLISCFLNDGLKVVSKLSPDHQGYNFDGEIQNSLFYSKGSQT